MNNKNCPNCGAAYTLEDVKCPYCGTLYYDLTAIDFTKNEPVFIKMRVPNGTKVIDITQCAYPRLGEITVDSNIVDIECGNTTIKRINCGYNITTNVTFDAISKKVCVKLENKGV